MNETPVPFGFEDVSPEEKARRVGGVFSSVAERYDIMNDVMSAGAHRVWKDNLIARINPQPGEVLIDVAGGTGDIARRFLAAAGARTRQKGRTPAMDPVAFVADMNEAMLLAAPETAGVRPIRVCCDAAELPFADRSADVVAISFGIRNVARIDRALSEFRRVLKPGGRFACLEFSQMTHAGLQATYDRYSFEVIPRLGQAIAGDRDSYQYLVESIRRFPAQDLFARQIERAGFSQVRFTNFSAGIAALHTGWAV